MRPMFRFFLILAVAVFAGVSPLQAQQFDVEAYKTFLATHQYVTGAQVLSEYPSVLFQRNLAQPPAQAAYLDSVILKYNLTQGEVDLLMKNGFMVSERLRSPHMVKTYSDVWHHDLPVLVTSDAVLHAMHMSYDELLKATEKHELHALLVDAIDEMSDYMSTLETKYGSDPGMKASLRDVDLYLTVARSLLGAFTTAHYYDNYKPVGDILDMVKREQPADWPLFSTTPRTYDFSQFTVRGHYEGDRLLEKYFQAFMWLGRTEFMLTKPVQQGALEQTDEDIQRQIIDAFLLREAVRESGAEQQFAKIDAYLTFLIGECDNLTMAHLDEMQAELYMHSPMDLLDMNEVKRFQDLLETKSYAGQRINSQILMSDPMNPEQLAPPSAFLLMGQRFILDSYIFGSLVYDKILYNGEKVRRMLPKSMDVLFAMGNNAAAQFLQPDMDEYHYAPHLTGLRYLIDGYGDDYWQNSMYSLWLNSIRALNAPADIEGLPEFMRTAAWWQQKMNTQLASWSQLRHDNLLYAKQSYSGGVSCSYPEAYVEPVPELYRRMALFGDAGERLYSSLVTADELKGAAVFFNRFSEIMRTLQGIAERELNGMAVTSDDTDFLQKMLRTNPGCGDPSIIDGWYAELFYANNATHENFIVADVHTAPTDETGNPVGWVMHAGTGLINTGIVIAPSVNGGLTAYTGAMLSYYEHVTVNFERLKDSEWAEQISQNAFSRPDWTNAFIADANGIPMPAGPMLKTHSTTGVEPPPIAAAPDAVTLLPGYPNPVSSGNETLIGFTVNQSGALPVTLSVYDVNGRNVATLVQELLPRGTYYVRWNAANGPGGRISAGVYMFRLTGGGAAQTQQIVVLD